MITILLILLILLTVGVTPAVPIVAHPYGYTPAAFLSLVICVLLILLLLGRI
jgi:hypothetical protein